MKSFHRRSSRPATRPPHVVPTAASAHPGSVRADQLLVERGLAPSRTTAQRLIEGGRVSGPDGPVAKPSTLFAATEELVVLPDADDALDRYVGRGGIKLAGALAHTGLNVHGRICLDIGQSTGGFTDCLLQAGASQVIGIDVGHGQLHPQLAADPRVHCIEGVNARELEKSALLQHPFPAHGLFELIVCDVSFISLTLIVPRLPSLLADNGDMLLLVKPQFEVGPQNVGKGGIVRDPTLYGEVEAKLRHCCAASKLEVIDWFDSPITGSDGNREFFMHLRHEKN